MFTLNSAVHQCIENRWKVLIIRPFCPALTNWCCLSHRSPQFLTTNLFLISGSYCFTTFLFSWKTLTPAHCALWSYRPLQVLSLFKDLNLRKKARPIVFNNFWFPLYGVIFKSRSAPSSYVKTTTTTTTTGHPRAQSLLAPLRLLPPPLLLLALKATETSLWTTPLQIRCWRERTPSNLRCGTLE